MTCHFHHLYTISGLDQNFFSSLLFAKYADNFSSSHLTFAWRCQRCKKKPELPNGRMLSSSVLDFKKNNYYVMQCKQRQDIIIHATPPQYAVIEHATDCMVKEETIVPFDRSDDKWKFATKDLGKAQTQLKPLQLHGIKEV